LAIASPNPLRKITIILGLALAGMGPGLAAQSIQSSFSSPAFDRVKPPSTHQDLIDVDPATGAVSIEMPLGPGIGARGAQFTPAVRGRNASTSVTTYGSTINITTGGFGFAPGRLEFSGDYVLGNFFGPRGEAERFGLLSSMTKDVTDPQPILSAFGYSGVSVVNTPLATSTFVGGITSGSAPPPSAIPAGGLGVTDEGALILPLSRTADFPLLTVNSPANATGDFYSYQIPQRVLVVRGDVAYEYSYVNHSWFLNLVDDAGTGGGYVEDRLMTLAEDWPTVTVSANFLSGFSAFTSVGPLAVSIPQHAMPAAIDMGASVQPVPALDKVYYVLSGILNRFDEAIKFTYGTNGIDYTAEWFRAGTDTGIGIQQQLANTTASNYQVRISYVGVPHTSYLLAVDNAAPRLGSLRTSAWWNARGTYVYQGRPPTSNPGGGGLIEPMWMGWITQIEPEASPGEAVNFSWTNLDAGIYNRQLAGVTAPGRSIYLTWQSYGYRENLVGDLAMGFYSPIFNYPNLSPLYTSAFGVTTIRDVDTATHQVRQTNYQRTVPTPNWSQINAWSTWDANTVVTHPDGTKTFYRFMSAPVYGPNNDQDQVLGGPHSTAEQRMRTLAYLKSVVVEQREYDAGTNVASDITLAPEQSAAFRVVVNDRFTLRSPANPLGTPMMTSKPIPTRIRTLDTLNKVMVQIENTHWDSTERGWRLTSHLTFGAPPAMTQEVLSLADTGASPSSAGAQIIRQADLHHQTDLGFWLLGRQKQKTDSTQGDTTGSILGGLPATVASESRVLDTLGRVLEMDLGATTQIKAVYAHNQSKGPDAAMPNGVTLQGAFQLSGLMGANYDYTLGFLQGIHPNLGSLAQMVSQTNDGIGRAIKQAGMDGLPTGIQWDPLGRLGQVAPPGQVASNHAVDSDGLGVTITTGAGKSQLRYNAFGNLILERRWNDAGTLSHRVFGYDMGNRRIWETIWRPGMGDETAWIQPLGPDDYVETPGSSPTGAAMMAIINPPPPSGAVYYSGSTHITYDAFGRAILVVDATGNGTSTVYGPLTRTITTGLFWDGLEATSTNSTAQTTLVEDVDGRLVTVIDANNQVTNYFYDSANRILQVKQFPSSSAPSGTPVGTGIPQIRTWGYNSLGWLVFLDQPESGVTYYTNFTVQGGATDVVYGLPPGWRPASLEAPDPSAFSVSGARRVATPRDQMNRVTAIQSADGTVTESFRYGSPDAGDPGPSVGKLVNATTAQGMARSLGYDAGTGKVALITLSIDGLPAFSQGMSYDSYGRLASRTYPDGSVQTIVNAPGTGLPGTTKFKGNLLASLGYDTCSWNLNQVSFANGASTSITYGPDQNQLESMTAIVPGMLGRTWFYSFDQVGHLLGAVGTDTVPAWIPDEEHYTYDSLGRLVKAMTRDPGDVALGYANRGLLQSFSYDSFGNRISANTATVSNWPHNSPPANPTTSSTLRSGLSGVTANVAFTPTSSAFLQNRLPATTSSGALTGAVYDPQGNLTQIYPQPGASSTSVTLANDAMGRATSLSYGPSSSRGTLACLYDDQGLRIRTWDGTSYTYNIYNESRQLIAQYNKTPTGLLTWKKDIAYLGTRELAEMGANGRTNVSLCDHLGTPRFLWDGSTTPVQQKFLPFGEPLTDPVTMGKFSKGFTNLEQTDASGLIYCQARFYLPMWGRFASPDPARDQHFERTQSWNIYSYCMNNPVMNIDPTGMWTWGGVYDQILYGVASAHVALQKVPLLGYAYSGGARLGEAIGGQKVIIGAGNGWPQVKNLNLEERKDASAEGTAKVGSLVIVVGALAALDPTKSKPDFFDGTKYTEKVEAQMKQGDFHSFPEEVKGLFAESCG